MLFGNGQFFFLCITRQFDDLHSVAKGWLNGIKQVGRGNEHDLGKIEGNAQVIISESRVLFWVQDFQQCGRWVSAIIHSNLIYFVHHKHWIVGASLMNSLDDSSWHSSDVGTAVTADFCLVMNSS